MASLFFALIAGLIFGMGLLVSGMANPDKVLSFLDLAGAWDPSLALVMIGAIAIGSLGYHAVRSRAHSLLVEPLRLPTATRLDRRLVLGSLAFGAGWGLAGFCPGPALVALGAGELKAATFVLAMVVGMAGFEVIERQRRQV